MSPQTETKAGVGFQAGVKDYKLTYYTPEYETKDTDILAAFRVSPQPGVPPEEAGAAVAAESSTVIDRQKNHGMHFRVLAKALRMSGGDHIHSGTVVALTEIFGDDSVLQFGGGTLGHPWGNAPGAAANRVALEACVQARNEGRDLAREGNEIIRAACKWSPELAAACEVWKAIKFEFEPVDTIDKKV
ncbi:hypothetical protein D1007_62730 [Hordeum vulgare]|nr:hypothetical protein D1007_62730 [Hordeum vulgare]